MNPPPSQPARHTLDGAICVFLSEALILPTGLLTAAFLTRRLGSADYGLLTLAATLVAWIEWSVVSIFARTTIKFVSEADDWRPVGATVMQLHLLVSGGAMVLLWLLAAPVSALFREPALVTYLRLLALDIPLFSLASVHRAILIGLGDFRQRALAGASRPLSRLLLILLFVGMGFSVTGAILANIGASLVELLVSRFYVRPPLFHRSSFPIWQLWDYALPLFLFAVAMRLYDKLDLFALKALGGTAEQAGFYGAAQNLSLIPGSMVALALSPLLLSTLTRTLRAGNVDTARDMSGKAMRAVILLLPFAGVIAGASPEVVSLIFGAPFLPAAPLLGLLIFGALALVMISVTTAILTAAGKPGWTFALTGPMLPLAAAGHLLMIPWLGAIGAAVVNTFFAIVGAGVTAIAVWWVWRVFPSAVTLGRSVLTCGFAYALTVMWQSPGFWLLIKLPVVTLIVLLTFAALGEFNPRELSFVRSMVRWRTAR
ncbi:MAG: oligosaccharide flippase family protein [Abditibacteriales bacterium]|nr:oligosaccharide flippase family protein [Abditibacteriales bacterium]MDW8365302.1 oligosaccharide flippase family protein [Abditibacteriales bacterium]